jgi:tRNA pseudouridine55 synthase
MAWHKQYDGLLLIDKPSGMSSHDVVQQVRRILGQREIGHTGTLDPLATGLLVLCLGKATKVSRFITEQTKTYLAEIRLGLKSSTYDQEGVDPDEQPAVIPELDSENLDSILNRIRGKSVQKVPAFSAVRINGQHLYELARCGVHVELPEREVEFFEIKLLEFSLPYIRLRVSCSKGTYIRTMANDIGEMIGCGGYLSNLRRTEVGAYSLKQAVDLKSLEQAVVNETIPLFVIPIETALPFPSITLSEEFSEYVHHGRTPQWQDVMAIEGGFQSGDTIVAKNPHGIALAVAVAGAASSDYGAIESKPVSSYLRVLV